MNLPNSNSKNYSNLAINFAPRAAQKLILRRLEHFRFTTAVCHRRLGKTLLAVNWLIREAQRLRLDDYRGYYFAPTAKQAKQTTWNYFKTYLDPLTRRDLVNFNETELRIDFPQNIKIYLGSAEAIENYRGIYIDRMVGDEVASWPNAEYAYTEVLRPAMADRLASGLFIGTVKGLDKFHEFYTYGLSEDPIYSEWTSVNLPVSLTKIIPESELAQLRAIMSAAAYEREFENNFYAEVEDMLISTREAAAAVNRATKTAIVRSSPIHVGIDVGRGGDPSCIAERQGPLARSLVLLDIADHMKLADRISTYLKTLRGQIYVYIDAGLGAGVIDRLRQLKHDNIVEIHFNQSSPEMNCANMRASMYYRCKKWLAHGSLPDDHELLAELTHQMLEETADSKIKLIRKRKIKEMLGRSPNKSDALALTFAELDEVYTTEEVAKQYLEEHGIPGTELAPSYDPLNYMDSLVDADSNDDYDYFS